jgi:hypothetical protein
MEAFQVVCMQDVPCWADDFLQHTKVAFVWSNQVAATRRRHLLCKSKCTSNMLGYRNPTWRRGASAAAFGAILNVYPA